MDRTFSIVASAAAFLAVALGAFGAHGLKPHFAAHPELAAPYQTAVQYHFWHALGLFAVAWALTQWSHPAFTWAGWAMIAGIVLFSGSLYLLALTGTRAWGMVTPFGGIAFLAGWAGLGYGIWRG